MVCEIVSNEPTSYDQEEDFDELLQPKIVTPLPLQTSHKAGGEVRLLCLLTGYPPAEVTWFLNGEVLTHSEDGRITFDNQKRMLVIKDVGEDDCGSITFQAKNKYGEASCTCYLDVTSKKNGNKARQPGKQSPKSLRKLMHAMRKIKSF